MQTLADLMVVLVLVGSTFALRSLQRHAQTRKGTFQALPYFAAVSVFASFSVMVWSGFRASSLLNDATTAYQIIFGVIFGLAGLSFLIDIALGLCSGWDTRIFCSHCGKFTRLDSTWVCGYCDTVNRGPIFDACELCKNEPKACPCQHCKQVIFFSEDRDVRHMAVGWIPPLPVAGETDEERAKRLRFEKERREHDLAIVRLDAELATEMKRLKFIVEGPKPASKSTAHPLEEDFERTKDQFVKVHEIANRALQEALAKYQNDPDMLERYRNLVADWKSRNS